MKIQQYRKQNRLKFSGLRRWSSPVAAFLSIGCWLSVSAGEKSSPANNANDFKPEFDRDIRPILAENCFPCHGPDQNKRKAKLRLDRQEDALKALPNGDFAIVPKDVTRSKVVERITSKDPDEVMPRSGSPGHISTFIHFQLDFMSL